MIRPRAGRRLAVAIAATLVLAGIAAIAAVVAAPPRPRGIDWRSLSNATYPVSIRPSGATLRDGVFDVPAAPGSASRIIVRLADVAAFGDLDGSGDADAAVVLVSTGGGSGTFVEIAAVRNDRGQAQPIASALLGDRVLVREVRIDARSIFVRMRARGATDPLSLRTREISRRYVLEGTQLRLAEESEADVQASSADTFIYQPQRIDVPVGTPLTVRGTLARGQIGSYVVHGRAGQVLGLALRSQFDNAVLSVFGLSDGITLVSRRDYAVDRSTTLAIEQDYAVKVVSLAGYDLPYELTVSLATAAQAPPSLRPSAVPLPSRTPAPALPTPAGGERPLSDASGAASEFARSRPPVWGVAVVVPSRGVVYAENADVQVPTASVVKVLVMLVVLEQARQENRPVSEDELGLLWPMITESDNDATSELWERIGRGSAVSSYLRVIGVAGFTPDAGTAWGASFVSARALASVLGKLLGGDILDAPSRALALRLLDGVVAEQRWGATAGTASDDAVGVKDGWYPGEEGWRVNSVALVRPRSGAAYATAIVTGGRASWREGIETIEGIAAPINAALHGLR